MMTGNTGEIRMRMMTSYTGYKLMEIWMTVTPRLHVSLHISGGTLDFYFFFTPFSFESFTYGISEYNI
jgi:hypothetical protein